MRRFGFHPLKAGRRLVWDNETHTHYTRFPSPQGGSETLIVVDTSGSMGASFHPLKAGRRHDCHNIGV